jgi:superfamily I DNA/RNA helicase
MPRLFKWESGPAPERETAAENATDGTWDVGWETEAETDEWDVVFRAWRTRLGTWRGHRSSSGVARPAQFAIGTEFMDDLAKLEKPARRHVMATVKKFGERTHAGVQLERVTHCMDDRVRTIGIDPFWRGVVFKPDDGDLYYLLKVLPHEKAREYAAGHRLSVNHALGVIEMRDAAAIEHTWPALEQAAGTTGTRLFARVSDADLTRLGVDATTMRIARLLTSRPHLDAMRQMIPDAQYSVLTGLASGRTPEEVWAEVSRYAPADGIDTSDVVKAMRRTPGRVAFVKGSGELEKLLEHPFAKWRVFLHPAQSRIAYAPRYSGPVQVTGGPGTGKTVTALHRAAFLASRASGQLAAPKSGASVLLTTFTRNLSDALEAQFGLLVDSYEVRRQVEVLNVDRLASRVVERTRGGVSKPAIIDWKGLWRLWVAASADLPFTPSFLNREWEQVILAQDLRTEADYLTASRAGQGTPLGEAQRRQVWQAVQQVEFELRLAGLDTLPQLANEAARALGGLVEKPYLHVIVDEAQDLHPAQWRLLRAAVAPGPDDLFIVSDPHQRIYGNHVSLDRAGINVKGRSRRLTVNYRTTQEIFSLAVPVLGKETVTGLDDEPDTLAGYRSPLRGRRPEVLAAATREAEMDALVARVRAWQDEGIAAHAIGIAVRSGRMLEQAGAALEAAGIKAVPLPAMAPRNAVRIGPMHGMKGLEFQAVAVIGVANGTVPAPNALTDPAADPVAHAQDLQRERSLLFVACTRARDHLYVSYCGSPSPFL